MRPLARIALLAIGVVAVLAIVVAYRTFTFTPPGAAKNSSVELAPGVPVDRDRAAEHLADAVRIRTVSHQDRGTNETAEFERFLAWLQATYPAAHAAMSRDLVGGLTPIYTWPGSDPSLPPIVLMAHYDVVPVTPGTEGDWTHPPFEGAIADGAVWGRGSVDNKGSLVSIFEAVEALAANGLEAGGSGAAVAAEWMKAKGVRPVFALDEGLAVVSDMPLLGRPVALIGVAEKGYATLRVAAPAKGGHSSAPPPETGVEVLAKAVIAITSNPFPMRFEGPGADMVSALAPEAGGLVRVAVANRWLFEPLLVRTIAKTPAGAATLHTTIAPTMLRGSPKENVLPQDATAWINYRILPGQTADGVLEHARSATRPFAVEMNWEGRAYDPPPVSSSDADAYRTIAALAGEGGRIPVAPGLVTATTDSRYLAGIAENVYRFQPIVASLRDFEMVHGTNEHMTLDNLGRMTEFYSRLIATAGSQ